MDSTRPPARRLRGVPELGLFPLPLVLVPTERIPLHIFESRYRELIAECLERDEEFGLVLATGDGAVHEVGTRAAVAQVVEELDDGRLNIVVEGRERFRLLELTKGRSFTTGEVEEVLDDADDVPDDDDRDRALELFRELAETAGAEEVEVPDASSPLLDFELAARVDFGVETKQELLASTSPRERMTKLVALLETALEALRLEQQLHHRASGNGKVSPLAPDA
jgi:Lon protease-like protein